MAFRVSRHPDGSNTVFFQKTGFKNLQRIAELAGRFGDIACNNQNSIDTGLSRQPSEKIIKNREARDASGHDVRHRLHAFVAEARRKFDSVAQLSPRCVRDVNTRAGGHNGSESRDPPCLQDGRLEGVVSDEILDGTLVYYRTCVNPGSFIEAHVQRIRIHDLRYIRYPYCN